MQMNRLNTKIILQSPIFESKNIITLIEKDYYGLMILRIIRLIKSIFTLQS